MTVERLNEISRELESIESLLDCVEHDELKTCKDGMENKLASIFGELNIDKTLEMHYIIDIISIRVIQLIGEVCNL